MATPPGDRRTEPRLQADSPPTYAPHGPSLEKNGASFEAAPALESRVVIEQAKGIIAAERQIRLDQAFERLRKHVRDQDAEIHQVASAVVHLRLRP